MAKWLPDGLWTLIYTVGRLTLYDTFTTLWDTLPYGTYCHEVYSFRLTDPWFAAYEAVNAMRVTRLDWQLHGFQYVKL